MMPQIHTNGVISPDDIAVRKEQLERAFRYYNIPLDTQRIFTPNGNDSLYSMQFDEAATKKESYAWVQINKTDKDFPKTKPKNKDIIKVDNVSFDFECPSSPSIAHAVGEAFTEFLGKTFFTRDVGLPIEDTGAGCHVTIPIPEINTLVYGGGDVVNLAVKLVVEEHIKPKFDEICKDSNVKMSLGAYDISRVLSLPGTYRPGGNKPDEINYLLNGYVRRFMPPFDHEDPERVESCMLRDLIIDATDDAYKIIQAQKMGAGSQPSNNGQYDPEVEKFATEWADNHPLSGYKGDHSAYFHAIARAVRNRFRNDQTLLNHAQLILDLSGKQNVPDAVQYMQKSINNFGPIPKGRSGGQRTIGPDDIIEAIENRGYVLRKNEATGYIEINGKRAEGDDDSVLRNDLARDGIKASKLAIDDAVREMARQNKYHPVKDYLNGLEWDGGSHITMLSTYFKDDGMTITDSDGNVHGLFGFMLRKWMIGAVAKALDGDKGKTNMMLVLQSFKQQIGKSTFVAWLCSGIGEQYHIEAAVNVEDKDTLVYLLEYWIWEVGELDSTTSKADVGALKRIITQQKVTVRPAYEARAVHKPALASMVGTVNTNEFLRDPSGNARYLTVPLTSINFDYSTEIDVNQLWAEAVVAYKAGEKWALTADERRQQEEINKDFEAVAPVQYWIEQYFEYTGDKKDFVSTIKIHNTISNHGFRGSTDSIGKQIKPAMIKFGAEADNKPCRGYRCLKLRDISDQETQTELAERAMGS